MEIIKAIDYRIVFNDLEYSELNNYIENKNPSLIIILVDTNTHQHCLSKFMSELMTSSPIEIIEIEAGEEHKTIDTCVGVWNALSEMGADRKSLMINLGGGVVTDLGGFVACTYRRGIPYINVPTSLLAMVDASVGGKTGVDLGYLKNQIGIIKPAEIVVVNTPFLETLPQNHFNSGWSEMLKHGLIYNREYWNCMKDLSELKFDGLDTLIYESIKIKYNIVTQDPREDGLRKTLNYGHTLGHAIESYYLDEAEGSSLLHGEAIAIGMILETFISTQLLDCPQTDLEEVTTVFMKVFDKIVIEEEHQNRIIELLKFDKKNEHGKINFVLLHEIGHPAIDKQVENSTIYDAFEYYTGLK